LSSFGIFGEEHPVGLQAHQTVGGFLGKMGFLGRCEYIEHGTSRIVAHRRNRGGPEIFVPLSGDVANGRIDASVNPTAFLPSSHAMKHIKFLVEEKSLISAACIFFDPDQSLRRRTIHTP
jgi:hypothetical protein